MSVKVKVLLGSGVVVVVLALLLVWNPDSDRVGSAGGGEPLMFFCAAGIKPAVEKVVAEYEAQFDVPIRLQYGGSGTLLSNLRAAKMGDLYLAGDNSYIEIARSQGLAAESIPLALMRPVIAVAKGNPKNISSVDDLLREDVRTAVGNPGAASVGKQTQKALQKAGLWDELEDAVRKRGVFKPTVNDIANDIKIGTVDAGIIWDSPASQYPELEIAWSLTDDESFVMAVTVTVLTTSKQPREALRFARYLGAVDKGLLQFAKNGYQPVDGDDGVDVPEL